MGTSTTYTYTNPITGTPSNGYALMSSGTAGLTWSLPNTSPWATSGSTISVDPNLKGSTLQVNGDADFKGDITIKGKSLSELIDNIEQRLAILHPNEKLEAKWEKLKKLGDEYREMEKEILHSEEMWKILQK